MILRVLNGKLKEVFYSVLPINLIVLFLHFFISPIPHKLLWQFLIGSGLVIVGLSLFLLGVDRGVTPLGTKVGESVLKSNKLMIVIITGFILGFIISFAEPGLLIFGNQVAQLTNGSIGGTTLLIVVSLGIAVSLSFAFVKIIYGLPLYTIIGVLYLVIFGLAVFSETEFIVIAFDASGTTTGVLAVPFILALTFGISHLKKDGKASEKDSFGTIAIVSAGAIISVLFISLFIRQPNFASEINNQISDGTSIFTNFIHQFSSVLNESFFAILPIVLVFLYFQFTAFKMNLKSFIKIIRGFIYTFVGLLIFLWGVNAGFMDVGLFLGSELAVFESKIYIILISFLIGIVTILAEPAVHVLTKQIEEVTSGYIAKSAVLIALSIGVGLAVALSVLRIFIEPLQIWHYLLPGYLIALTLMFFVPKIFVGIAFDAGGVATGPITATFILAFTQGAAGVVEGAHLIRDGLGMVAMVALMPIITLQILGLIFRIKSKKGGVVVK